LDEIELTVLMPCLDEAETLAVCIRKARGFLARAGVAGEVLIADNGSTDGSQAIALAEGARVVDVPVRGYGAALIFGIKAARGRFVIMGDSDDSYDFSKLDAFVGKLREGYALVMGNRFRGGIMPGAMPKLHRYLGNPVLTAVGRLFYGSPCGDFHCGLRGFERAAMLRLDLQSEGMEFASEMVVKATVAGLRVTEVPTVLHPDGRSRPPHLRSWRDGWRHLRFLLLYSPRWLFLYPGLVLFVVGFVLSAVLLPGPVRVGRVVLDVHTLLFAGGMMVVGFQAAMFWVFAKIYGAREGIVPPDPLFQKLVVAFTVERAGIAGVLMMLVGLVLGVVAVQSWTQMGFGPLSPQATMRYAIPSVMLIMLAFNLIYSAAFMALLQIRATRL
jgi:glycosyltransferase involved in cell wall biosynthesis